MSVNTTAPHLRRDPTGVKHIETRNQARVASYLKSTLKHFKGCLKVSKKAPVVERYVCHSFSETTGSALHQIGRNIFQIRNCTP